MSASSDFKSLLARAAQAEALSEEEAKTAFAIMMSGGATSAQIAGLLMALRVRGESVAEISGAVTIMREKMTRVEAPSDAIDIVGTGGDGSGTYNISTAAAFIAAGAGAPVAKHGNRALSSISGAADVLTALGVNIDLDPSAIAHCIKAAGVGFMFAPSHHPAMRHVGSVRIELGTRTLFNLLGPLSNPAGVKRQMTGVFAPEWVTPIAQVLCNLGCEHAWIVHGDGLDEITVCGPTQVVEIRGESMRAFTIAPEDVGLERASLADLKGGDATANAKALLAVLDDEPSAYRDAAIFNAGAGLVVAGRADDIATGVDQARRSVTSGAARKALDALVEISNKSGSQASE